MLQLWNSVRWAVRQLPQACGLEQSLPIVLILLFVLKGTISVFAGILSIVFIILCAILALTVLHYLYRDLR